MRDDRRDGSTDDRVPPGPAAVRAGLRPLPPRPARTDRGARRGAGRRHGRGCGGAPGPIVEPLPREPFTARGADAEMPGSAPSGRGFPVPIDRFFARHHTSTPIIDSADWRVRIFGAGLRTAGRYIV
ncbi:hypothetical protein GCM10020358_33650 [Amorphoplanes nipponensis]|uniref:Uncharacterized protein n=1 Tax=Actinoplanes nipponensis TaxID=135950 RepID=A0A919MJ40_9ACTN|nr:hypothetical protein Ani05nite_49430 [Actinoplanes nipponensis]